MTRSDRTHRHTAGADHPIRRDVTAATVEARSAPPAERARPARPGTPTDVMTATTRPSRPVSLSRPAVPDTLRRPALPDALRRPERPARTARPARQQMDTPMTTSDGPIANHPAAAPAPRPAPFPAVEEPVWAATAGSGQRGREASGQGGLLLPSAADRSVGGGVAGQNRSAGSRQESAPWVVTNGFHHQPPASSMNATPTIQRDAPTSNPPIGILQAAEQPNVDPCDIACDAMPAHLIGDLTPREDAWLLAHTNRCTYCRNVLHRYHRIDDMLDRLQRYVDPLPVPPPFRLPAPTRTPQSRSVAPARQRRASYGTIESPIGPLRVAVSDAGVCEIGFAANEGEAAFRARLEERGFAPAACLESDLGPEGMAQVTRQLQEYFGGKRDRFDIPIDFSGVSPFTKSVLTATAAVPFGQWSTYREIAAKIGSPGASRAVGNALGRNPIPVIGPCHRIVRSDATLGGYTGGLGIKERLLEIEGVVPSNLGAR